MLKTAEPTIVPIPTSLKAIKTPIIEVNNSGADPPKIQKIFNMLEKLISVQSTKDFEEWGGAAKCPQSEPSLKRLKSSPTWRFAPFLFPIKCRVEHIERALLNFAT